MSRLAHPNAPKRPAPRRPAQRTRPASASNGGPELRLQQRLDVLPKAARAELLHVLMLPDLERVERIGEFWSYSQSRAFAELLIDAEEDRTLRAVLIGMLRDIERPSGA